MITQEDKLGGIGASDVGKLFTSGGLNSKTAHSLAYDKAYEMVVGYKKEFTTPALEHGLANEVEAFESVILPSYPDAVLRSSDSILVNEKRFGKRFWATPDVSIETMSLGIDIKNPTTVRTYYDNTIKVKPLYSYQLQTQILALEYDKGALMFYLTKGVESADEYGNVDEYDIDINERHKFLFFDANKLVQDEIEDRVEEFLPMVDTIYSHLFKADEVSDRELFELYTKNKITQFTKKSNLLAWDNKIIVNKQEGFFVKE